MHPLTTDRRAFGRLLSQWRQLRGKSQLALALEAGVSARHVSFVESGRANPSREMISTLAGALGIPLRERNSLFVAAGYAPLYRESAWATAELAPVRRAIELILAHQEPYPAVVLNRHWDVITTNTAAATLFETLLGPADPASDRPPNVVRLVFDEHGLRPHVMNWEQTASALIQRVHREAVGGVPDERTRAILHEVLSRPGVPEQWQVADLTTPLMPLVPVEFAKGALRLRYFSTVTTLGTPQDVTVQELRVECFFPVDDETSAQALAMAHARP
jgi:transcriptional regulator with XRE-family HTH domain